MSYLTEEEQREKDKEMKRRTSRQQIIEHVKKSLLVTVFDVKWVPVSSSFVAVGHHPNNQGSLQIYRLNKGELQVVEDVKRPVAIKCCTFGQATQESRHVATGNFTGGLNIYDIEKIDTPIFDVPKAHDSIINGIDGALYTGPPEVVTGSRDGAVKVWDSRQSKKPVLALAPVDQARARDCWTVKFGNSYSAQDRVITCGYDNGDVKLYDMRAGKMLHEFNVSNGVCDLEFDRPDIEMNKLIVSSLEGRIRVYDLRTQHPELGFAYVEDKVSSGTIWTAKALPQNREIFMCGGAGEYTLCKYAYPPERSLKDPQTGIPKGIPGTVEELNKVKVGDQPINSIDWNRGKEGLAVSASFDQTVRVVLVTKLGLVS